ncbi:cysteine desulfurase [Nematocida homosporus]|uniref:cysteine desulfurase n=1 Tax=Nematocida homosporus TaxID=1912981 RepID=UPI00221F2DF2|nr:cysteine desulfurase [Nematocida homosporus]KAI5187450.1 cysteine desulfurase [Nematocida homosporus]
MGPLQRIVNLPKEAFNWLGWGVKTPIYMDLQATTPTDPRVVAKMLPYFNQKFGNPHSRTHEVGWAAEKAVEEARSKIAKLINADPQEIIFTSGATESNNLAIKGVARFYKQQVEGTPHIITTQIEHKCVIDTCRDLEMEGFEVTYLPVDKDGQVSPEDLKQAIKKETILASIMAVNNEVGTIAPLKEIGQICRENNVFFHTDAAQAVGKIPLDVRDMNISLMSISGHKIYGPMGSGALFVSRKAPRPKLQPLFSGGGQERGMRSGTLATPLIVGLGEACDIARVQMAQDKDKIERLSARLFGGLQKNIPGIRRNGGRNVFPGCVNISFPYVEGESLLMALPDIALSSGSACTSASLEPSYVLKALGVSEDLAHSSLRFGIGRFTTEKEVDYVVKKVSDKVKKLQELSPLFEMAEEGIDLNSIEWAEH